MNSSVVNELLECIPIVKGEVISLTGVGGKTTCMYKLGEALKVRGSVLLTTTTKIWYPDKENVEIIMSQAEVDQHLVKHGRVLVYGDLDPRGKCRAISSQMLGRLIPQYDYTVVEADGSRGLPLKGYLANEPVVPKQASLHIGIVTLHGVGQLVDENNVLRVKEFCEMVQTEPKEQITIKHMADWIAHPAGLFRGSLGRRVLLFNQIESKEQLAQAMQVINVLDIKFLEELDQVVAGSLFRDEYRIISSRKESRT